MDFIDLETQYRGLRDSINARIQKVLDHGRFILGPEVAALEERLARHVGAKYRMTCGSIPTAVHYPVALHQQPACAALFEGECYAVSEQLGRGVLSLPMHPCLDEATQTRIAEAVRTSLGKTPR